MFGSGNGNGKIDSALGMFTKAEKQIKEGIELNEAVMAKNAEKLKKEQEKLDKLKEDKAAENADLTAKNKRGQAFMEKIQAFFGELPTEEIAEKTTENRDDNHGGI